MHFTSPQQRSTYTFVFVIVLCGILWTGYSLGTEHHDFGLGPLRRPSTHHRSRPVEKTVQPPGFPYTHAVDVTVPAGVKVIGLVFFGRRELVQVLDCYLKRNLKEYGGLLDEVIWSVNTDKEDDLAYLEELVASNSRYRKHEATKKYEWYIGAWEAVQDPHAIYLKIDDDVVYFEDNAIPALVKRLLENPQYFTVSANIVNNPALSWVHRNMGVYEGYYPEMTQPHPPAPKNSWRASELPSYKGPIEGPEGFAINASTPAPFRGHRWLPIRLPKGETYDMSLSPASLLAYDPFGPGLYNWAAASQTHYSFLHHLEQGDTWRYKFNIWDYDYMRLSINFLAIRGKDVMDVFPFPQKDDESYLVQTRPSELRRRVIIDGTALAVHFAFNNQYTAFEGKGIRWTDALDRYKAYADQMICPGLRRVEIKEVS
ncbi:hypothetical protein V8E51_018793 [Hyaloscypha variabilis]